MSVLDGLLNKRVLSVRNLLITVTGLLLLAVIVLSVVRVFTALDTQSVADRSQTVNKVSDDLAQLKFAAGGERIIVNTAYGLEGSASSDIRNEAEAQRQAAMRAFNTLKADMEELPDFPDRQDKVKALDDAWAEYKGMGDQIADDLAAGADQRVLRSRSIMRTIADLVEAAADLRSTIEINFTAGNARLAAVRQLKYQLWVMIEYAGRDSASIGNNIASGEKLNSFKLQIVSQYSGHVRNAWSQVQNVAQSDLVNDEIRSLIEPIKTKFFQDFSLLRDDVYMAADLGDDYPVDAQTWMDRSREATAPISSMAGEADALATELNEQLMGDATGDLITSVLLLVVAILIGAAAAWIVLGRVVAPVNALTRTMTVLADGNLDAEVPHSDRVDEIGEMARAVQVFKENAVERQRLEKEQREQEELERQRREEEEKAKREDEERQRKEKEEADRQAREERRRAMLEMADQFEKSVMAVVEKVSRSASDMESSAREMSETAEDTSQRSAVVTKAAEQASSNAQMVASAAEELSSSVREITGQTTQSSEAARDAVKRTEEASKDIAELVSAADKIGEVVQLINDIAEQTNLLALNATIEAARAGDAGKGFAVVASEVKNLASQTGKATEEISGQVSGMQNATNTAVKAMEKIKEIISDIDSTAVSIASAVEEQDASTQEIARNVSEVSTGTNEVTSNMTDVNEGAASTGKASNSVLSSAQDLTRQSDDLRTEVEKFLTEIRQG
ncbi:methyl-accepting chemotaxis protein [Yunchengibacter salinarum]|uniref:methyl-accepting chemotaxis protein n=1 Tax=Yunchengibacter salinarum TaxID=3133399 RepID=UPI0035B67B5D